MKLIKIGELPPIKNFEGELNGSQAPTVVRLRDGTLRVYFSSRDSQGYSRPVYREVKILDNDEVFNFSSTKMVDFPLGNPGTFLNMES